MSNYDDEIVNEEKRLKLAARDLTSHYTAVNMAIDLRQKR